MHKLATLLFGSTLAVASVGASANVIYTFIADGVTESVAQQATARFDFANANTLTLTLTDNVDPTAFLMSELSGLSFTFSQAPTALTLTGVNATSVIDCSNLSGSSCPPAGDIPALYGWGSALSGGAMTLGAGYSGSDFGWAPFDIVNQNYVAPGSGGLSDPANNPLLVGPVVFTFHVQGLNYIPEVTSATFLFGDPDSAKAVTLSPPSRNPHRWRWLGWDCSPQYSRSDEGTTPHKGFPAATQKARPMPGFFMGARLYRGSCETRREYALLRSTDQVTFA